MAWTRAGSRPSYSSSRSPTPLGFCAARLARSSVSSCFPRPSSSPWRAAASSPLPSSRLGTKPTRSLRLSSTVSAPPSQLSLCILLDSRPRRYLSTVLSTNRKENSKREKRESSTRHLETNERKLIIVSRKVDGRAVSRFVKKKKDSRRARKALKASRTDRFFHTRVFPFNFSNLHLPARPISVHGVPPKYPEDDKAQANIAPRFLLRFAKRGGDLFSKNRNEKRKSDPLSSRRQRSRER